MISDDLALLIQAAIEDFVAETTADPLRVRIAAKALNALPLLYDMGGCYLLRANGDLISFAWNSPDEWRTESDPRIVNIALFQGSKKYPALASLIPSRPPDSAVCPQCGGTGRDQHTQLANVVCYCGGLGWIPSDAGRY